MLVCRRSLRSRAAASELAINTQNDDVNALTPVEQLARALGGQS